MDTTLMKNPDLEERAKDHHKKAEIVLNLPWWKLRLLAIRDRHLFNLLNGSNDIGLLRYNDDNIHLRISVVNDGATEIYASALPNFELSFEIEKAVSQELERQGIKLKRVRPYIKYSNDATTILRMTGALYYSRTFKVIDTDTLKKELDQACKLVSIWWSKSDEYTNRTEY